MSTYEKFTFNDDRFYIKHDEQKNTFKIKEDFYQLEKNRIITSIEATNNKIKRSKSESEKIELRRLRKLQIEKLKILEEIELVEVLDN